MAQGELKLTSRDELLYPPTDKSIYSWCETNYYGFNIPEHRLNGEVYVLLRPNLRTVVAGFFAWKGFKKTTLAAEYFDYQAHLPFPTTDLDDYELANGLKVKILAPLKKVRVDYVDENQDTEVHFISTGIMPPHRPGPRGHYDQAVKVDGELVLRGEKYVIDGHFTRDRSWGSPRPEVQRSGPPMTWLVGVFGDDFAFHTMTYDDPAMGPEWAGAYQVSSPPASGYVYKDGVTRELVKSSKLTLRGPDGLEPRGAILELEDDRGDKYSIKGEATAVLPWHTWPNMLCFMTQMRWECGGRVGWGDFQDIHSNSHVVRFMKQ
ncbi:MAG: hypothetical protein HY677_02830 [Chloroflexi bacterium]|nr:hypothetical protein [Chloroflexota bacterium]